MDKTPKALRKHIGIFGDTNSGKSALFNRILNQEMAIVSENKGTTTDPVVKAMELIPFGPIILVDTAGLNDDTAIGDKRTQKTYHMLKQMDYALLAVDYQDYSQDRYIHLTTQFSKFNIPYTTVFTKSDLLTPSQKEQIKLDFFNPVFVTIEDEQSIERLRQLLNTELSKQNEETKSLVDGLLKEGDHVVLVIPIDSEAPKGRLILPQVQLMRECLDHGIMCHVSRETELKKLLHSLEKVNLVVTDSQAFKLVDQLVPKEMKLTSFSMLLARQKSDLKYMFDGLKAIEHLKDGDKILMAEACTHNVSHEDIGRIKIPNLLKQKTRKELQFDFCSGFEFPEDLNQYSLIVHCGGCMITNKSMQSRTGIALLKQVPITNYGVILAYLTGAIERQNFLIND